MSIGLPCRLDGFIQFSGNDAEMAGFSAIYEFQLQKPLALINLYACTVFCIFAWQVLRRRLMIALEFTSVFSARRRSQGLPRGPLNLDIKLF